MRTTLALCVSTAVTLFAQSPATFEVATMKVNRTSEPESGSFEHGLLRIRGATLRHLAGAAYDVRIDLVVDGPGWLDTDRFDVEAKADPGTSEAQSRVMLRALLAERFQLKAHREFRLKPVFVLTVAAKGPARRESPAGSTERSRCFGTAPLTCYQRTMAQFADVLPRISSGIERPVVDETGLQGRYDFTLTFAQPGSREEAGGPESASIFQALQQQLGLKLTDARRPIEFLVIDGANRAPTAN